MRSVNFCHQQDSKSLLVTWLLSASGLLIIREGIIDDVITQWYIMSHVQKMLLDSNHPKYLRWHKMHEKVVVGIVTFDLIIFSHLNHIAVYMHDYSILECMRKCLIDVNRKLAQAMQNIWNFIVGKLILLKKWQTRAIIGLYLPDNYYPGDTVQNLESPGLNRKVDSTAHYYLVYKLKTNLCVSLTHCEREGNNSKWWRKLKRRSETYKIKKCWDNRNKDKHIITRPPHRVCLCNWLIITITVIVSLQ